MFPDVGVRLTVGTAADTDRILAALAPPSRAQRFSSSCSDSSAEQNWSDQVGLERATVAAGDDEGDRGAGVDLTAAVDERGALKRPPALGRIDDRAQAGVRVEGVDRAVR